MPKEKKKPSYKLDRQGKVKNAKHGGARPGTGRPKGALATATREKRQTLKRIRERIYRKADDLVNVTIKKAMGEQYLYCAETFYDKKTKRSRREITLVTDPKLILAYLNEELNETGDKEYYYITTTKPNLAAINSLMDRGFGRPKQVTEIEGDVASLFGNVTINFTDAKQVEEPNQPGTVVEAEASDSGDPVE